MKNIQIDFGSLSPSQQDDLIRAITSCLDAGASKIRYDLSFWPENSQKNTAAQEMAGWAKAAEDQAHSVKEQARSLLK